MSDSVEVVQFEIPVRTAHVVAAICEHGGLSPHAYIMKLINSDIASRREAGWNVRDGWKGKEKLEAKRAASFKKTPPRKKVTFAS